MQSADDPLRVGSSLELVVTQPVAGWAWVASLSWHGSCGAFRGAPNGEVLLAADAGGGIALYRDVPNVIDARERIKRFGAAAGNLVKLRGAGTAQPSALRGAS